ncbi:MAG TPA: DNA polymerase III subunit delta [Methylovirgula sp.]|nr:DNA polymerase III subunit delta [Methylovirgula sp.]
MAIPLGFSFEHDLVGKPVPTFPDHGLLFEHDLVGKPVPTFPDHGLLFEHDLVGKPASTFPDHGLLFEHDLVGKPVPTFPDHALMVAVRSGEAERFIARPPGNIFIYLVFGQDAGLVSERVENILARSIEDRKDPFQFQRISGDELAADPLRLADEANTVALFGGRRAIAINAQARNFIAALETVLASPPSDCTIVIEAGALKRDAPLRKLLESSPRAAAIECLSDSAKDIAHLIETELRTAGLSIDPEAKALLVSLLGQDRLTTRSELGKLILYAQGAREITSEHVAAIIADASSLALDTAINGAFDGDYAAVEETAARVFAEGGDYNALLGAALRHAMALHRARLDAEGGRAEAGYRRGAAFDRHMRTWTSERLMRAITTLSQAIAKARYEPRLADMIAVRALWSVALAGRRGGG